MAATTIEDKIVLFNKILFEKLDKEFNDKRQKLVEDYEAQKEKVKKEYEQKKEKMVEEYTKKAQLNAQQMIAKAKYEVHYAVLKRRQELVKRLLNEIKEYAREFVCTEEYKKFLTKRINNVSNELKAEKHLTYYFTSSDLGKNADIINDTIRAIKEKGTYSVESTSEDIIGGFYVETQDKRLYDVTIKTLIEDNHTVAGQILMSRLKEVN